MTETPALAARDHPADESVAHRRDRMRWLETDAGADAWPLRPWIMAIIGAVAGLAIALLTEGEVSRASVFLIALIGVGSTAFVLTVERRWWVWSAVFAVVWGLVIGFITWTARSYSQQATVFEFPVFASLFAALLAAPLFQAWRDGGRRSLDPGRVHLHLWSDAAIAAAGLAFAVITWGLTWLIAGLFDLIGIKVLSRALGHSWVALPLLAATWGAGVGVLRERDAIVATMLRLVFAVMSVLAPIFAVAIWLFLLTLPFTGLDGLWNGWGSAAALTMLASAFCLLLLNAAIGLAGEGVQGEGLHRLLHWSARALGVAMLPLGAIAAAAILQRVGDYGWTPGRMWAAVCAIVALTYGLVSAVISVWPRGHFPKRILAAETRASVAVCVLALILALPWIDFGAMSTRDQLARLRDGRTTTEKFDWAALAFDFGPSGRRALEAMAASGPEDKRRRAREALAAKNRYEVRDTSASADARANIRVTPTGTAVPSALIDALTLNYQCRGNACRAHFLSDDAVVLVSQAARADAPMASLYRRCPTGRWEESWPIPRETQRRVNVNSAEIRLAPQPMQRIVIDGLPVGSVLPVPLPPPCVEEGLRSPEPAPSAPPPPPPPPQAKATP